MLRGAGATIAGFGVTIASTFVPSLGLSVHQKRIGFAIGVALILVGVVLLIRWRGRRDAAIDSVQSVDQSVRSYHQSGGITARNVTTKARQSDDPSGDSE
jgi:hypothetical protein